MIKFLIMVCTITVSFATLSSCGLISRHIPQHGERTALPEMSRSPDGSSVPQLPDVERAAPINRVNPTKPSPQIEAPGATTKRGRPEHPQKAQTPTAPKAAKWQPANKKSITERRQPPKSVPVQHHRIVQKSLSLSELRRKYASSFKIAGPAYERKVALTFDDGPDEIYTVKVLDVLKNNHVKATFFVIGSRAAAHPGLIARMVREGHIVGNHSYNHAQWSKLTDANFEQQVVHTQSILSPMLGYEPKLLRPPYGAVKEEQIRWLMNHGFLIVNWNVDSLDWKGLSAETISRNILSTVRPGSIILQHCGGGNREDLSGTVKALPGIIKVLKSRGYEMVTVPELLHVSKKK